MKQQKTIVVAVVSNENINLVDPKVVEELKTFINRRSFGLSETTTWRFL